MTTKENMILPKEGSREAKEKALCEEYSAWLLKEGIRPPVCAEEALLRSDLTAEQKRWILDFINRWEEAGLHY